jgi:pimeloyl-ACP methyl ester carboxylesterase
MKLPDRRALVVLLAIALAAGGGRLLRQRLPVTPASTVGIANDDWLQLGSLRLLPCEIGAASAGGTVSAYCASFPVPENRDQPQTRTIELHVAIVKSPAAAIEPDLLVFLDGGPGGAATDDYVAYAAAFADMRRGRHLLLIDQRGTGASNPLSCQGGQSRADANDPFDLDKIRTHFRDCLVRLQQRADPRFYTTTAAVRDLEAVRQALGAPLLNLIGVSYGTRVAQQYARTYPAAVRSIVLDSAVPNSLALGSENAANLDAALKSRFAACVRDAQCQRQFGDPYQSLLALRDRLRTRPQMIKSRDPQTFELVERRLDATGLMGVVRLFAYSPMTAALLPLTISEALKGNYDPLLGQEKLVIDGVSERLTDGMGLSVVCTEDADLLKPRPSDENTLLGNSLVEYQRVGCEVWPHGQRPAEFHQPFETEAPTLILAGELDPVTPVRYGAEVAERLPNARLLTLHGQGHAVMGEGCMPRLAGDFIRHLQPRRLDASCLDALGDTPVFLGFSGAAP